MVGETQVQLERKEREREPLGSVYIKARTVDKEKESYNRLKNLS